MEILLCLCWVNITFLFTKLNAMDFVNTKVWGTAITSFFPL